MNALKHIYELKPFTSMWKGDKIHGTVKKDLVRQYERLLELVQTIILTNFNLAHESGVYRTTTHPFKIIFRPITIVYMCDEHNQNLAKDRKKALLKGKKFQRGANTLEVEYQDCFPTAGLGTDLVDDG
ncbi:hypothetical protein Bca101_061906 [Brassica carinata]